MIFTTCKHLTCPNPAPQNTKYCDTHINEYVPRTPFFGTGANPSASHYSTPQWRLFRKLFTARFNVCSICGSTSKILPDHSTLSAPAMLKQFGKFLTYPDDFATLDDATTYYRALCLSCNTVQRNKNYSRGRG